MYKGYEVTDSRELHKGAEATSKPYAGQKGSPTAKWPRYAFEVGLDFDHLSELLCAYTNVWRSIWRLTKKS